MITWIRKGRATTESEEELVALIKYLALTGINIWSFRDSRLINNWELSCLSFDVSFNEEVLWEFNRWYNNNDNNIRCEGTGGSDSSISLTVPSPEERIT